MYEASIVLLEWVVGWWYVGGGFVHTDHFTSEVSEIYKIEKKYCKSNGV